MNNIVNSVAQYITKTKKFEIQQSIFKNNNGRLQYNKTIRDNVENKFGIYLWINKVTNEVIYMGMAGRINARGGYGGHTLRKRLVASRMRKNMIDIQTNHYVKHYMNELNIETLIFYVLYSKADIPPSYLEAILLYEFYKKKGKLPFLNKSF